MKEITEDSSSIALSNTSTLSSFQFKQALKATVSLATSKRANAPKLLQQVDPFTLLSKLDYIEKSKCSIAITTSRPLYASRQSQDHVKKRKYSIAITTSTDLFTLPGKARLCRKEQMLQSYYNKQRPFTPLSKPDRVKKSKNLPHCAGKNIILLIQREPRRLTLLP